MSWTMISSCSDSSSVSILSMMSRLVKGVFALLKSLVSKSLVSTSRGVGFSDLKENIHKVCSLTFPVPLLGKSNWRIYLDLNWTTFETLLWDTSIKGTPPFSGHKIWSRKYFHIIFVFVTSFEGIPLIRGDQHFFWLPKPGFNLHWGDTLAIKKWLTTKIDDRFKCSLISQWRQFSKLERSHLKSMYCTCKNPTHNIAEIYFKHFLYFRQRPTFYCYVWRDVQPRPQVRDV